MYSTDKNKWRVEVVLMNGSLKSILYFAIGIAILVIVFRFVSFMLPYVLIAALVIYVYNKIRNTIRNKESHKSSEDSTIYYSNKSEEKKSFDSEDGDVIDVDYKDVK